jgi:hypothetical protein
VCLIISSISEYLTTYPVAEILIDDAEGSSEMRISFKIEFPKVPCALTTVDSNDILGNYQVYSYLF